MTGQLEAAIAPDHALVVEGPQIFERTAPARHQDHIRVGDAVERLDGAHDPGRRLHSLTRGGRQDHLDERVAPAHHVQHVLQGGPAGGCDDPNAARAFGDRPLALRGE